MRGRASNQCSQAGVRFFPPSSCVTLTRFVKWTPTWLSPRARPLGSVLPWRGILRHLARLWGASFCGYAGRLCLPIWHGTSSSMRALGGGAGYLLCVAVLAIYFLYALGTGSFTWWRAGVAAAFVLVPVTLAARRGTRVGAGWAGCFAR